MKVILFFLEEEEDEQTVNNPKTLDSLDTFTHQTSNPG